MENKLPYHSGHNNFLALNDIQYRKACGGNFKGSQSKDQQRALSELRGELDEAENKSCSL